MSDRDICADDLAAIDGLFPEIAGFIRMTRAVREVTNMRWRSVSGVSPLPDIGVTVLCYAPGTLMVASRTADGSWKAQHDLDWVFGVTHWMPLPEPP